MSPTTLRIGNPLGLAAVLVGLVACQGPSNSAGAPAQPRVAPLPPADAPTEPTATNDAPEPAPPAETPAPVDTRVADACKKLCERKDRDCKDNSDEVCRADCEVHELKSKGCEQQVEAALLCQASAKQSPCSNVAAGSCTDAFVQVQRCQRGDAPTEQASTSKPPAGWKKFTDDSWGVSLTMPADAELDAKAASRTYKASLDGVEYEVREIERPKKLTDNAFIKLVIAHVGVACQRDMRLTGRVDNAQYVSTEFATGCATGPRLYGKVRVDAKRALSLLVRGEASPEQRTVFFDGIR